MANNPLQEYYSARQAAAEARQANENYRIQQERALQEQAQRRRENEQMKVLYADKYGNTSTSRGQMYGETEQMRRDNLERDMNAQSAGLFGNKIDPTISHDVAQNFSEYEQQAFGDLLSQGANIEDAYTAVKNGGSVTHDAGMLETAGGALKQIGVSALKDVNAIGASVGRIADSIFGKDKFKPFDGKLQNWFDKNTDYLGNVAVANRQRNLSSVVSYDKNTGKYEVRDTSGLAGGLTMDIAGAVPLIVECMAGPVGVGAAVTARTSDSLHEYELTEKEENDLWDLACAIGKGTALAVTMELGGAASKSVGKFVTPKMEQVFSRLVDKYGLDASRQFLANRVAGFLCTQAAGIANGEIMMVGDVALSDAIDNVFKGYDKDIVNDMKHAAVEGLKFHVGMQAVHGAGNIAKPFRIRGEYKDWREASKIYADNLKKNGFTYKGTDDILTGEFKPNGADKARKCFIINEHGDKREILYKNPDAEDRYTYAEVDAERVKKNVAGFKKVDTFAGSELVRFVKPDIPVAYLNKDGKTWNYQYNGTGKDGHKTAIIGTLGAEDGGRAFYVVDKEGNKRMGIYDEKSDDIIGIDEYDYYRRLNEREAVEEVEEQPVEETNTVVEEIPAAKTVTELSDNENYANRTDTGDVDYTTIDYEGETYIVPKDFADRMANEPGDFVGEVYHAKIGEGIERVELTIPAPEKERILNEDMGNFTDADLHEFVGEDYKGADAGGVEPKVEEEKTEELQPTDDGQSDAQGEQAEQQQTVSQTEPKAPTDAQQQQPQVIEQRPLVDAESFAVDMTQGAGDNEIYVQLIKASNAETSANFEVLMDAVKDQLGEVKKAKQYKAAMTLTNVLDRLKVQHDVLKEKEELAIKAKKEQMRQQAEQAKEARKIEEIERQGRIADAQHKVDMRDARQQGELNEARKNSRKRVKTVTELTNDAVESPANKVQRRRNKTAQTEEVKVEEETPTETAEQNKNKVDDNQPVEQEQPQQPTETATEQQPAVEQPSVTKTVEETLLDGGELGMYEPKKNSTDAKLVKKAADLIKRYDGGDVQFSDLYSVGVEALKLRDKLTAQMLKRKDRNNVSREELQKMSLYNNIAREVNKRTPNTEAKEAEQQPIGSLDGQTNAEVEPVAVGEREAAPVEQKPDVVTGAEMQPTGKPLTDEEIARIKRIVREGGKENISNRSLEARINTLVNVLKDKGNRPGFDEVSKDVEEAIAKLQEELTKFSDKQGKYKEENKGATSEYKPGKKVSTDLLKHDFPSTDSAVWKRFFCDLRGIKRVDELSKKENAPEFKSFIDSFVDNYDGNFEKALKNTLFDENNLPRYGDKTMDIAANIKLIDEGGIKKITAAVNAERKAYKAGVSKDVKKKKAEPTVDADGHTMRYYELNKLFEKKMNTSEAQQKFLNNIVARAGDAFEEGNLTKDELHTITERANKELEKLGVKANADSNSAPMHLLTREQFDGVARQLENSGLFKEVKVTDDILSEYERECGKEAADAIRGTDGELLGFTTRDGRIFLNSQTLNADTFVHEMAHNMFGAFRKSGIMTKQAWDELDMLAEKCGALDALPSVYKEMSREEQVEEAVVRAIGRKGGMRLSGGLWERFKELAKRQWALIKSYLGLGNSSSEVRFSDLVDAYAGKIVDGKFAEAERKALEEMRTGITETEEGFQKEWDALQAEEEKQNAANAKLSFTNNGGKGEWDSNEKFKRVENSVFKAHDIKDERNSVSAQVRGNIQRILYDSFDPLYRFDLSVHKDGGHFDGRTDSVERMAQIQSIVMSQTNKLMRNEIKGLDDAYKAITGKKLTITRYGQVVDLDNKAVDFYLQCLNAKSGTNDRMYNEMKEKAHQEELGATKKSIQQTSRSAMIIARMVSKKMKSMRTEIDKYELEYANATDKDAAEKKLVNAYRRLLVNNNEVLKKALNVANSIRDTLRKAEKAKFESENPGQTYVVPAELEKIPTLGLHTAKFGKNGLKELRTMFLNAEQRIGDICADIEQKKIQDRLNKFEEEFEKRFEEDKKRMPQTEWLYKVWEPAHPKENLIWDNFHEELEQAIEDGTVQRYKTDGRGVSNAEAEKYCKEFENKVDKELVKDLQDKVKAVTDFTIKNAKEGQIISEAEYNELADRNQNEHYVPLRGFEYDPKKADSDFNNALRFDRGKASRSVATKAEGRISPNDSVYKSLINMAQASISNKYTNLFSVDKYKQLLDCKQRRGAQANYNGNLDDLVLLGKWYKRANDTEHWQAVDNAPAEDAVFENGVYKAGDGEYMWTGGDTKNFAMDYNMSLADAQNFTHTFYYNGQKMQMVFKDKTVADALNQTNKWACDRSISGMLHGNLKYLLDKRRAWNNLMSKWLTSWSIRFAISNHERDLATYAFRLTGCGYQGVSGSLFESYGEIFKFIVLRKKDVKFEMPNGEKVLLDTILNDWGLATGFVEQGRQGDFAELERKIEQIRDARPVRYKIGADGKYTTETLPDYNIENAIEKLMDKRPQAVKDGIEQIGRMIAKGKIPLEYIPKISETLELVPRLAAFKVALKNGADIDQAVQFGKNITANFNKNGDLKYHQLGKYIYATVPFFNAGLQGMKMAYDMTQRNPSRMMYTMIGMLAVGFIANELERLIYGKTAYGADKITTLDDYNRGSSLRIPVSSDGFIPVSMPHYFRMPLGIAMNVSDCIHGDRSWNETFWGSVGALADVTHFDFSKLGESENGGLRVMTQFAPTELKLYTDLKLNENFFGAKIYGEAFNDATDVAPEWTKTIGHGTYPALIEACRILNEIGGGTDDFAAGSFHITSDGSILPNKDGDMGSVFDQNPQAWQYLISQFVPITQMGDYAYRRYGNAVAEGEDAPLPKAVISFLQLDKVALKNFPNEEMTAGRLAAGMRNGMEVLRKINRSKDYPKTPQTIQAIRLAQEVKRLHDMQRKIKANINIAVTKGDNDKVRELNKKNKDLIMQEACRLYQLQKYAVE